MPLSNLKGIVKYKIVLNMTGLTYIIMQIHPKDQSRMNIALLWKHSLRIDPGMFTDQYYETTNYKHINTKNHLCTMENVKHSKCVEEFYMNQLGCSLHSEPQMYVG